MPMRWFALSMLVAVNGHIFAQDLPAPAARSIDFARDIEPLLATRCFPCHAVEEKKGGLALDSRAHALQGGNSGPAIEPGESAASLLIEKVAGLDPVSPMPPKGKAEPLNDQEISILRAWIDQDAPWGPAPLTVERAAHLAGQNHWAFRAPVHPNVPTNARADWPQNPIDAFILKRLEHEGLSPAPEAARTTLIRRLHLDLLGLPPTPEEIDAFVQDPAPNAYERLVDRLLASPRYGERWARRWLDLARYADTNGYEKDRERSIWPYRDWVIRALNADLPFDQFSIEQIAGDLLPNPTLDQHVATGFHRNTMINEEGGIDVEEFRFAALVDRVATTATTWLGLTLNCAQCHTHKYDPIPQRDYYRLMALLDNADEPELEVPDPRIEARRQRALEQVAALESNLAKQFPLPDTSRNWTPLVPTRALAASRQSQGFVTFETQPDGTILVSGAHPELCSYTLSFDVRPDQLAALRLVALEDPAHQAAGPGRTAHGNFVVTNIHASIQTAAHPHALPLPLTNPTADFSQTGFDPAGVLDPSDRTGWAVDDGSGRLNKRRHLSVEQARPVPVARATLQLQIDQHYGGQHTLGRFRVEAMYRDAPPHPLAHLPEPQQRQRHLQQRLHQWQTSLRPIRWIPIPPIRAISRKHASFDLLDDASILVSGDKPNNDVYDVELPLPAHGPPITAIRLEALPHPSHPEGGPGRAPLFSLGDFILTEVEARLATPGQQPRPLAFQNATHDHAEAGKPARLAIDGKPDTGWSIKGAVGKPHQAVFQLAEPITPSPGDTLQLSLHQFGIHQMTIGRFRLSLTHDAPPIVASGAPAEVEDALLIPDAERTPAQSQRILDHFLATCPELDSARASIQKLKDQLPKHPTTMVLSERPPQHKRTTRIRQRGEFLRPGDPVEPGVPAALHPLPENKQPDRLALARWLVSPDNPLVGRVTVNRDWQAFFGRGLVSTPEDFGTRGDPPTHPELLDWLAHQFIRSGWSRKALHRLIVTSATYRQDAHVTSESRARDPKNLLLARAPRLRVDAETVRDIALASAGLLDQRIGGPSVYPPQPESVTALAYGGTAWPTSEGLDRYRRGLYTFIKRTAPFAAYTTFDMPSSEVACARRERSNTPLQALTLLNDAAFIEAAQALARRAIQEAGEPTDTARLARMYTRALGRQPDPHESAQLLTFLNLQRQRFQSGALDAAQVAGIPRLNAPTPPAPASELAAWTTLARVLLNCDELITRE